MGTSGTLTKDTLKKDKLEKTNSIFEKVSELTAHKKKSIEKSFSDSLPADVESEFFHIYEERQILDLPISDVYVVFPFQNYHDRWFHVLYSHNRPVVIAPLPYSDIFSYGVVYSTLIS